MEFAAGNDFVQCLGVAQSAKTEVAHLAPLSHDFEAVQNSSCSVNILGGQTKTFAQISFHGDSIVQLD